MDGESAETKITLTLYRGLNGTNPGAFRVDEDGISVFENSLPDYKYNLPIRVLYRNEKVSGAIAEIIEPLLEGGIAEYTPQFGDNHWSLRFPNLEVPEIKSLLSKYAKAVLK
ncbi:MAG: hypothetical protein LH472_04190 [Pyrinomonadaceae bacterium]|nr:hypothetical protein [Pyrinomonadaceae bacterium]